MANIQYSGFKKIFLRYWKAYGGFKAVFGSPYMHLSVLITIASAGNWVKGEWMDIPMSVLPNIIGFSLGGYAIWLALGDDKFRASITGKTKNGGESPFIVVNATFVHFISLQILALLISLIAKSKDFYSIPSCVEKYFLELAPWLSDTSFWFSLAGNFIGYFLFVYAIMSALAATMAIFRISGWLEVYHVKKSKGENDSGS